MNQTTSMFISTYRDHRRTVTFGDIEYEVKEKRVTELQHTLDSLPVITEEFKLERIEK